MIQISQLKLPIEHTEEALLEKIARQLHIKKSDIHSYHILKRSIDARNKEQICYVYSVTAAVTGEKKILARAKGTKIQSYQPKAYRFPIGTGEQMDQRPVIVGSGPAGLFCAWMLAQNGYRPIVLERGDMASRRKEKVSAFWGGEPLDPESNVQFGEGGAGTFSDGKLNTGVHDKYGRNREVLRIFVQAGAPEQILYDAKPHLGTDLLIQIVETMRNQIIAAGGEFHFRTKVSDLLIRDHRITGVKTEDGSVFESSHVVLAVGHSARDTFAMLADKPLLMEAKPFAVGVRVEHAQERINDALYGPHAPKSLGAAPYKLTRTLQSGRGCYSFCMCPGGYVVNASSEPEMLAVNGMSYHARNSANANSAIVVTVHPEDFRAFHVQGQSDVLDGLAFQRHLERAAYREGEGCIPVQTLADFENNRTGNGGSLVPCMKGAYQFANLRNVFPEELSLSILSGMHAFDRNITGYANPDTLLSGVESRTSSPVRIVRNDRLESTIEGLFPCGEGAGYAGGITSAAMDGLKVAEEIASRFRPFS